MGGGIGSLLGSLFGGGGQQVPQTTAGAPPAPAAAPAAGTPGAPDPMAGGLGGFQMPQMGQLPPMPQPGILDSPALQGLLGAYFGAIGSPRSMGLGGAISRGGLGGLAAYQQAKEGQYKPYLMGLQMADAQARLAGTQLGMQKTQLELHQMAGEQESNKQTAAAIMQMAQHTQDPDLRAELMTRAQATASAPKWVDPGHLFDDLSKRDKDQIDTQLAQANLTQKQWEQQYLDPAKLAREQVGIAGEQVGMEEKGLQMEKTRQELAEAPVKAGAEQIRTEAEVDKQLQAEHPLYRFMPQETQARMRTERLAQAGVLQPRQQPQARATSVHQLPPGARQAAAAAARAAGLTLGSDGVYRDASGTPHEFGPPEGS